ncbi:MAG: hypothetical protein ACJA1R_002797, partial [Flavobacteriales bacterium]
QVLDVACEVPRLFVAAFKSTEHALGGQLAGFEGVLALRGIVQERFSK